MYGGPLAMLTDQVCFSKYLFQFAGKKNPSGAFGLSPTHEFSALEALIILQIKHDFPQ